MIFHKHLLLLAIAYCCSTVLWSQNIIAVTNQDLTGDNSYVWTADNEYLLDGVVVLEAGGVLTIEPGTVIRGKAIPSDSIEFTSFLIIEAGARIIAEGTREEPIIFTSENDNLLVSEVPRAFFSGPGLWGGLIVAGQAPVSGDPGRRKQALGWLDQIEERIGRTFNYSGTDEEDDSGVISYVSVRNAGGSTFGTPGVALMGVGRGTTVNHVEVHNPRSSGLRLVGGTVDLYHILSSYNQAPFTLDWGYKGRGQFWFGLGSSGLLKMDDESREVPEDDSSPDLSNLTLLSNSNSFLSDPGLISFEGKSRGRVRNSVISENRFFAGISIDSLARDGAFNSIDRYRNGELVIDNNVFVSRSPEDNWNDQVSMNALSNGFGSPAPDSVVNAIAAVNILSFDTLLVSPKIQFPLSLDPMPKPGTSIISGGVPVTEEGFTAVDYQGAFAPDDDWWHWTYLYQIAGNRNVSGRVVQAAADCTVGEDPVPAAGVIVRLMTGGTEFYATSDADGYYSVNVFEGPTTVSILAPNENWLACPGPETFGLARNADTTINLALAPVNQCAVPTVSLGVPFLRRGFDTRYRVTYSNAGTVPATNVRLKIELDTSLFYVNTNYPSGQFTYYEDSLVFQLPDLEPLAQPQTFWIDVNTSFASELGQEHCTFAKITSAETCEKRGLLVDAECVGDSVRFRVQNTLQTNLPNPIPFVVIEDEVMLRQGTLELDADASESFIFAAEDDATYHFSTISGVVNLRTAATLICGNTPGSPVSSFPLADGVPGEAIDCQFNVGAYDPNDKTAAPLGIGRDRVVPEQTEIDYRIRFQNTGTDTAFQVIVIDTLPEALDPATLRMGAYSHPCTWTLEGERTLKVIFDNIMLPDSNVNEPASNGFFKFRIAAREGAGLGTEIVNEADIYFDFNEPVRTNFTYHLIDEFKDMILSSPNPKNKPDRFTLYPQPAGEVVTLELTEGTNFSGNWSAYAIDGRLVASGNIRNRRQEIELGGWTPGTYIIVLRDHGHKVIGVQKLLHR